MAIPVAIPILEDVPRLLRIPSMPAPFLKAICSEVSQNNSYKRGVPVAGTFGNQPVFFAEDARKLL
jgi:hypothetical protein